MTKLYNTCLLCVALFTVFSAAAQNDEQESDRAVEARIIKLEDKLSWIPRISGFVQLRYQYQTLDGDNSFDVKRARLDFKGDLAAKVDYRLQLEFASSPKIIDAFVRYTPFKQFGIQIGQFKVPFTLENPYAPLKLEAIDNAMAISYLAGFSDISGISATGRDIGLSLFGTLAKGVIDYGVGIYNGAGINRSDDNNRKDFAGRLNINPTKALTLSGSVYIGNTGAKGSPLLTRNRYSFGARYDDKRLLVRTEYVYGKTDALESEGWYAIAGWWIKNKIMPMVRCEGFQQDISLTDTRQTNYMAGIDYWPIRNLRMQVNYTYRHFRAAADSGLASIMVSGAF